jgi:hypothetical protein
MIESQTQRSQILSIGRQPRKELAFSPRKSQTGGRTKTGEQGSSCADLSHGC